MRTNQLALCILVLSLVSCQPKSATVGAPAPTPLERFSQALAVAEATVGESALTLIDLEKAKVLTRDEASPVMDAIGRISRGGALMAKSLKGLNALSDADRQNFLKLLQPMMDSANEALERHIVTLKPETQSRVKTLLVALKSALELTQAALTVR